MSTWIDEFEAKVANTGERERQNLIEAACSDLRSAANALTEAKLPNEAIRCRKLVGDLGGRP